VAAVPSGLSPTPLRKKSRDKYYHVCEWLQTGFGLIIQVIEHLQIVTTSNYSAITNSHTLQFTTARTKSSQSDIFISHCLVTDPNKVLCFRCYVLTSWRLSQNSLLQMTNPQAGDHLTPNSYSSHCSLETLLSQSQSHIATDGQSVSKSWYRAPSGAHDQIFNPV
jgi:hypothetical protein